MTAPRVLRLARPTASAATATNDRLQEYVQGRVAGVIARPDGEPVPGPEVRFIGRRHGRGADRRWARSWSPEQIPNRLRIEFPDDDSMRVSHEAIYQALYIQGRGALKRELVACLVWQPHGTAGPTGPKLWARQEVRDSADLALRVAVGSGR